MTKTQEKKKIKPHFVQEILRKSMSSSIWKDLPPEVLENVLACLPAHVLCRFRLVCKKWNHLISQPSFTALRALSPRKASSIFISPKLTYRAMTTSAEWHVLDPTEKRSYKLSDSFIKNSFLSSSRNRGLRNPCWDWDWSKNTLAADGELIYIMYRASAWSRTRLHIVCNPVSESFHEIPELPEILELHNHYIVVMSVDNATKNYKIVRMEMCRDTNKPGSQNLFLYESMTSAWRKLCEAPDAGFSAYSSIFMKGILYTLFVDLSGIPTWPMFYTVVLYSCDFVTGAWCKMEVDFPPLSTAEENLQLVVSSGRLYMVKFTRCRTWMVTLSIWKIVLETKEVVKVAKIQNFSKLSKRMFHGSKVGEMPVAVGCADSIIISCKEGRRMEFDLLEKRWQELPGHTLDKKNGIISTGICVCLVDF